MAQAGIKENELTELAREVNRYADSINDILNSFDSKFFELESYYKGKSFNDLKLFYSDVRNQFSTVNQNIMSYSDDFIALIRKMKEAGDQVGKKIQLFTDEAKKKNATIDENFLKVK